MFSLLQHSKFSSVTLISHVHLISDNFILQLFISQFLLRELPLPLLMGHHIINTIDAITSLHPYAGIVILGDFNSLDDRLIRSYSLKQIV
jgi:hypothetical protein